MKCEIIIVKKQRKAAPQLVIKEIRERETGNQVGELQKRLKCLIEIKGIYSGRSRGELTSQVAIADWVCCFRARKAKVITKIN